MIKNRIIAVLLSAVLLTGTLMVFTACGPPLTGSGDLVTQDMDFTGFTKLDVSNAFEIEITREDDFYVSITVDDNLVDLLDVKKSGSILYIGLKPNRTYLRTTQRATITMPDLTSLDLSGSSKADMTGFSSEESLRFRLSGASLLMLDDIEAGNTSCRVSGASTIRGDLEMDDGDFEISGASRIELDGSAKDIRLEVSGASTIDLGNCPGVDVSAELSGASTGTINLDGILNAKVSGASSLYYVGNPVLGDIDISGASRVRAK